MANTHQVKVMVPVNVIEQIDREVDRGNFAGRGDFALYAIRYYLDRLSEGTVKKSE